MNNPSASLETDETRDESIALRIDMVAPGISASQVESIELIRNPSSRYDAAGTSGIINIRLKKNKIRGFNGSASVAFGQGLYPKNNNNLQLNYRSGKINLFLNYSLGVNQGFGELYALRKYYEPDEKTVTAMLEQPSFFKFSNTSHTIKTGIDYSFTKKNQCCADLHWSTFGQVI